MLALMVIMILVIVLGGLASYQIFLISQTQNLVIQSQKNQSSIALWKSLLVSKARAVGDNKEYVLPIGENKTGYHTLPSWLYFNTKNPWGKDFIYCPYGPISTGTLDKDINLTLTTTYKVRTTSNFATMVNGSYRDYVVSSDSNGITTDVLAFIISPIPSTTNTLPKCTDVEFDVSLNAFKVSDGLVDVITKSDIETFANLSRINDKEDGESSSVTYINTVEGDISATNNTLTNNLNYIAASDFKYVKLKLPAGTNTLSSVSFNDGNDSFTESQRVFILEGDSSGTTIINGSPDSKILFNNYKVVLKNLKLSENIMPLFNYSNLKTENVELSNVHLENSEWLVFGSNDKIMPSENKLFTESYPLYMHKSTLNIGDGKKLTINEHTLNKNTLDASLSQILISRGELTINKNNNKNGIVLTDSVIKSDDSNININTTVNNDSDILVDEFSKILAIDSSFNVSGRAVGSIVNRGSIVFKGSSLITNSSGNYGIVGQRNSSLILKTYAEGKDIVIGNTVSAKRPQVAILDYGSIDSFDGAGYFGGSPSVKTIKIYSLGSCAYGPAFIISGETLGTVMPVSTRNDYTSLPPEVQLLASKLNASNWECIK